MDQQTVVLTRVFDVPRRFVFETWLFPKQFAQWWGPKDFTNPICDIDVRRGFYHVVMRSPDCVEYPLTGLYREVVAPERIVITCDVSEHPVAWHDLLKQHRGAAPGKPATKLLLTVTFEEQGGKTKLTVHTEFPTAADRDAYIKMGMEAGESKVSIG